MKHILAILILFIVFTSNLFSQDEKKLDGFKSIVLTEYSTYFNNASLSEGGKLQIQATDNYNSTDYKNKQSIIYQIISAWQDSLILVSYNTKRELWSRGNEKGKAILIDQWDYSIRATSPSTIISTPNRPLFFYVGAQIGGDNQSNLTMAFNLRFGFFLLKNRWDFATTFSGGVTGNTKPSPYSKSSSNPYTNFGIMSRVHFPIKQTGFSPNIGAELSTYKFGDLDADIKPSLVIGFSWFVGIGSIDLGVKISEVSTGMGGYTMYPNAK